MKKTLLLGLIVLFPYLAKTQIDEDRIGAWYMYFFTAKFGESQWGVQGDAQWRNWNLGGDLEQLLLRGGVTYRPKEANILLTIGYANITTGTYGEASVTTGENRIYQEALYPVKVGNRVYLNHRVRFEQRFIENQDFRTRYRFNLMMNIPVNQQEMSAKAIYLAFYNELFINGQREIGSGNEVELYDRNRFYSGIGYIFNQGLRTQLGFMNQSTDNWQKNQLQFSFHHNF